MAWKTDILFYFLAPNLLYVGCSGETWVYASFLNGRSRIWTKIYIFSSGVNKKGEFKFADGNGRPSKKGAWSEETFSITIRKTLSSRGLSQSKGACHSPKGLVTIPKGDCH
jgi:hypothetical protein